MIAVGVLLFATVAWLAVLAAIALAAQRERIPRALARHPLVLALSLGVYASSWTYYGGVGFAQRHGLVFLAVYLGPTLACMATPLLWSRVLHITREQRLSSLADLLAFRFQSPAAGALVAAFSLVASLPYVAQQFRATEESVRVLSGPGHEEAVGAVFCALLALFTAFFGARPSAERRREDGLATAVAFESAAKLAVLAAVGLAAVLGAFGGPSGLAGWLRDHAAEVEALARPVREDSGWTSLLVISFAAAFLLPRQWHMAFASGAGDRALARAAWAFPLFLLALNLPVLPILWAGTRLAAAGPADSYVLLVPQLLDQRWLALAAFIGGISAASAMVMVTAVALANDSATHLLLPLARRTLRRNVYARVLWMRRGLLTAILVGGWLFHRAQANGGLLVESGIVSFVAFAQLLPGLFAVLFWERATRAGFIAGLLAGIAAWTTLCLAPLLPGMPGLDPAWLDLLREGGRAARAGRALPIDTWSLPTFVSLAVNGGTLGLVSLLRPPAKAEREAARLCRRREIGPSVERATVASSVGALEERLARLLGREAAGIEVTRARIELDIPRDETRPTELHALQERLHRNLSPLVGPVLARTVAEEAGAPAAAPGAGGALTEELRWLERRLARGETRLVGAARELDLLRRWLRSVLAQLPLGVCAVGSDGAISLVNRRLEALVGALERDLVGAPLDRLPAPFAELFARAVRAASAGEAGAGAEEIEAHVAGRARSLRVHRAALDPLDARAASGGVVLLVEDRTEQRALEAQLAHKDRLAQLGRLAAGVAHEVGNPLTGIACLAQNLRAEADSDEIRARAGLILGETARIEAILRTLLEHSRTGAVPSPGEGPRARVGRVSLAQVIAEAERLLRLDRAAPHVRVEQACPESLVVVGDRRELVQVFVNLLANARDASGAGATIAVRGRIDAGEIVVEVEDHGSGIPEELLAAVFEPFVTTKRDPSGTGLGLPLSRSIVQDHGGTLTLRSAVGQGTTVVVRLPLAGAPGARRGPEAAP
ncbi:MULTISPECIES: ATP-binding protein [Sorangium]|uniref:histidine kinase n=1 Tax=Sorangium cellulosum TaxID=56 RepID=A0A4P2QMY2_SORCE|nr:MULTISPECIES: ATP-binding protein [Sorangium]AUX31410.1 ATPase [Sorangium cellulosum]WCQ90792.1 kinase [Sorangium sp. Soce836]